MKGYDLVDYLFLIGFAFSICSLFGVVVYSFCATPFDTKDKADWQAQTEHRLDSMQIQIDSVKTTISVMTE
jgi:hypothetical protein